MLLQEHCGQDDQTAQYICPDAYSPVLLQRLALMDRDADTQRVKYMQARKYIRSRIRAVQHSDHIHKNVVSLKDDGPQILSVREHR